MSGLGVIYRRGAAGWGHGFRSGVRLGCCLSFVRVGQLGVRVAVEFAGYFQLEL